MKKLTSKENIRRMSLVATVIVALFMISPVVAFVRGFISGWNSEASVSATDTVALIQSFVMLALAAVLIFTAFRLTSPFSMALPVMLVPSPCSIISGNSVKT